MEGRANRVKVLTLFAVSIGYGLMGAFCHGGKLTDRIGRKCEILKIDEWYAVRAAESSGTIN